MIRHWQEVALLFHRPPVDRYREMRSLGRQHRLRRSKARVGAMMSESRESRRDWWNFRS